MLSESSDAHEDLVFEYWAGNPSNEIFHGHITVAAFPDVDGSHGAKQSSAAGGPEACMALATSVPCHMSAPEFCDFVGAFGSESHRRFRHCRVLHGHNSEEYLLALQMASPEDVSWLVRSFHGRPYNAIEASICSLHPVLSSQTGCLEENASPSAENCALAKRRSPVLPPLPPALPQSVDDKLHSLATGSTSLPSPLMLPSVPRKSSPLMSPCSQPEVPELFIQSGAGTHGIVSPTPTSSGNERSYCAVCFETVDSNPAEYQLTELGGGVPLTILCGHTFHARCLSRWCDSTCPVCRFQQHPYQTSSCDVCGQVEGVHICLVCGFIGCTAHPGQGHAQQHFEATSHAYALDVNTQHVWDYAGNGYVHRLLYNDQDGKMVEHSVPQDSNESLAISAQSVFGGLRWADMEDDDCDKIAALFTRASAVSTSSGAKKQEAIVGEFNNLLSSQLTAQRQHFDELRQDIEKHAASEIEDMEAQVATAKVTADSVHRLMVSLQEESESLSKQIKDAASAESLAHRQRSQLEEVNKRLSQEQRAFEDQQEDQAEQKRGERQQRDREISELQQEIKDLELFLQMRRRCEASADVNELQAAHLLVTEGENRRGRRNRRR